MMKTLSMRLLVAMLACSALAPPAAGFTTSPMALQSHGRLAPLAASTPKGFASRRRPVTPALMMSEDGSASGPIRAKAHQSKRAKLASALAAFTFGFAGPASAKVLEREASAAAMDASRPQAELQAPSSMVVDTETTMAISPQVGMAVPDMGKSQEEPAMSQQHPPPQQLTKENSAQESQHTPATLLAQTATTAAKDLGSSASAAAKDLGSSASQATASAVQSAALLADKLLEKADKALDKMEALLQSPEIALKDPAVATAAGASAVGVSAVGGAVFFANRARKEKGSVAGDAAVDVELWPKRMGWTAFNSKPKPMKKEPEKAPKPPKAAATTPTPEIKPPATTADLSADNEKVSAFTDVVSHVSKLVRAQKEAEAQIKELEVLAKATAQMVAEKTGAEKEAALKTAMQFRDKVEAWKVTLAESSKAQGATDVTLVNKLDALSKAIGEVIFEASSESRDVVQAASSLPRMEEVNKLEMIAQETAVKLAKLSGAEKKSAVQTALQFRNKVEAWKVTLAQASAVGGVTNEALVDKLEGLSKAISLVIDHSAAADQKVQRKADAQEEIRKLEILAKETAMQLAKLSGDERVAALQTATQFRDKVEAWQASLSLATTNGAGDEVLMSKLEGLNEATEKVIKVLLLSQAMSRVMGEPQPEAVENIKALEEVRKLEIMVKDTASKLAKLSGKDRENALQTAMQFRQKIDSWKASVAETSDDVLMSKLESLSKAIGLVVAQAVAVDHKKLQRKTPTLDQISKLEIMAKETAAKVVRLSGEEKQTALQTAMQFQDKVQTWKATLAASGTNDEVLVSKLEGLSAAIARVIDHSAAVDQKILEQKNLQRQAAADDQLLKLEVMAKEVVVKLTTLSGAELQAALETAKQFKDKVDAWKMTLGEASTESGARDGMLVTKLQGLSQAIGQVIEQATPATPKVHVPSKTLVTSVTEEQINQLQIMAKETALKLSQLSGKERESALETAMQFKEKVDMWKASVGNMGDAALVSKMEGLSEAVALVIDQARAPAPPAPKEFTVEEELRKLEIMAKETTVKLSQLSGAERQTALQTAMQFKDKVEAWKTASMSSGVNDKVLMSKLEGLSNVIGSVIDEAAVAQPAVVSVQAEEKIQNLEIMAKKTYLPLDQKQREADVAEQIRKLEVVAKETISKYIGLSGEEREVALETALQYKDKVQAWQLMLGQSSKANGLNDEVLESQLEVLSQSIDRVIRIEGLTQNLDMLISKAAAARSEAKAEEKVPELETA